MMRNYISRILVVFVSAIMAVKLKSCMQCYNIEIVEPVNNIHIRKTGASDSEILTVKFTYLVIIEASNQCPSKRETY